MQPEEGLDVSLSRHLSDDEGLKWDALTSLRERLFKAKHSYLFVDPTSGVPWDRSYTKVGDSYSEVLVAPRKLNLPKDACPFLVPLNNEVGGIFDWTFEIAWSQLSDPQAPYPVCAWIGSDLEVGDLQSRMSKQMLQSVGVRTWLFRFYDPRVSQHLVSFVSKEFCISGPTSWSFLDASGRLQKLPVSETESIRYPEESSLERLDWLKTINAVINTWPSLTDDIVEIERIYDAARVAAAVGLQPYQQADCVAFILHRCLVHERIELHPIVSVWLNDAREMKRPYADAAAHADADVWKGISAGDWQLGLNERQGLRYG